MANSHLITEAKNRILVAIQNDEEIIKCLGLNPDEDEENLIGVRLFPQWKIGSTQEAVKSYILVEVKADNSRVRYNNSNRLYMNYMVMIRILCHETDTELVLPNTSATRQDYLSELLDVKFNGMDIAFGKLELMVNEPFVLDTNYLGRDLIFAVKDLNDAICG